MKDSDIKKIHLDISEDEFDILQKFLEQKDCTFSTEETVVLIKLFEYLQLKPELFDQFYQMNRRSWECDVDLYACFLLYYQSSEFGNYSKRIIDNFKNEIDFHNAPANLFLSNQGRNKIRVIMRSMSYKSVATASSFFIFFVDKMIHLSQQDYPISKKGILDLIESAGKY